MGSISTTQNGFTLGAGVIKVKNTTGEEKEVPTDKKYTMYSINKSALNILSVYLARDLY